MLLSAILKRMNYLIFIFFTALLAVQPAYAADALSVKLSGKILLQVESYGRAWYVDPTSHERYYMKDGKTAYSIMRSLGLGITNADLQRIPTQTNESGDRSLVNRLRGRILLQVEENGEAWYVNPEDGLRYYMKDGEAAYEMMRSFALGISNADLATIPVTPDQIAPDTAYNDVAYVLFNDGKLIEGYGKDTILPLASMTKLMTALVLLDTKPNWDRTITISQEVLDYPRKYVGNDATSEVGISRGDTVKLYDLWVAMLLSSSNQSAAALVEAQGFSVEEFVELMNEKAKDLGLTKTEFFDVAGLDAHNVTTPYEMAIIGKAAFDQPIISEISVLPNYTISAMDSTQAKKEISAVNRNYSLFQFHPDGVKTGYLVEAERNVVLKKDTKIIVVMHALSMKQRNSIISNMLD